MFRPSKQSGFIPLLLTGILFFGAVSAEAGDHHRRSGRTAKGAVIGAVAGTLFQIIQGNTDGDELLTGAVVGGTIGAALGSESDTYRGRYHDRYHDGNYDYDGYYHSRDDEYWDDEEWDGDEDWDEDYEYADDDRDDGYYRDRYERYGSRGSHRHGSHCDHR